jgi:prophage regulatory protein
MPKENSLPPTPASSKVVLRQPRVSLITGLSRASIYSFMAQGRFPMPISLGERSVGWIESEVLQWIESRIALRG